jgi:lambda repressor-like predicted transcriptional regulator
MKTITGWCLGCRSRIGTQKFRQLIDGKMCADCHRLLPAAPIVESVATPTKNVVPPKVGKYKRVNYNSLLLEEEAQLIEAFNKFKNQGIGKNWVKPIAKILNWDWQRTAIVARRVRKKGISLKAEPIEQQILAKLSRKAISAYELANDFATVDTPWISLLLKKMAADGQVEIIRDCIPHLYRRVDK